MIALSLHEALPGHHLAVFSLFVAPIVRFCNYSMFCCALLCVHSSYAIVLMGKKELVACFFVFLVSHDCCGALSRGARGLSAVYEFGISSSYSLTILLKILPFIVVKICFLKHYLNICYKYTIEINP